MLITLIFAIMLVIAISIIVFRVRADKFDKDIDALSFWGAVLLFISLVGLVCCLITVWVSYEGYLDHRAFFDSTKEQYFSSIKMYTDRAVLKVTPSTYTFNELRYEDYQANLASYINTLRDQVVKYNKGLIIKRKRNENPFFNWLIIIPDPDMKPIELLIKNEEKTEWSNWN